MSTPTDAPVPGTYRLHYIVGEEARHTPVDKAPAHFADAALNTAHRLLDHVGALGGGHKPERGATPIAQAAEPGNLLGVPSQKLAATVGFGEVLPWQKLRGVAQPVATDRLFVKAAELPAPSPPPFPVTDQVRPGDATTTRDINQSPVTHIDVRYSGTRPEFGQKLQPADFRVNLDGSVQMLHNPNTSTADVITVEVQQPPGVAGHYTPPFAEQKAVDELVDKLSKQYMQSQVAPDGQTTRNGDIIDNQGLVSDQAKESIHARLDPEQQLPQPVRRQVEHINRHGGRGRFTPRQAAEDFAPRDVPRQQGETDKLAALKDVASGFLTRFGVDQNGREILEKDPYHAVHNWEGQGSRVGRYGIGASQYRDWLKGLSKDEIAQLIKDGKLPQGALELQQSLQAGKDGSELTGDAKQFNDFLNKMQSGQGQFDPKEIDKFLPKDLQERIGTDMIKSYAVATADKDEQGKPDLVNVGKVALSMVLGHAVTDAEANLPQNKAIVDAAYKQYALAVAHEQNAQTSVNMSNANGKIASVARSDVGRALWSGSGTGANLGCASSVSTVLREAGVANVHENSVHGLSGALRRQHFTVHNFSERRPGDVIIVDGGRHGHTGVVGENANITYDNHSSSGRWTPDTPDYWARRARGSQFYVLRPPSNA